MRVRPRLWLWWSPKAWRQARAAERFLNYQVERSPLLALAALIHARGIKTVPWRGPWA